MSAKVSTSTVRDSFFPTQRREVRLYTASGARPNPGPAVIGFLLFDQRGDELASSTEPIGHHSNNAAEYFAVIAGLRACVQYTTGLIRCFTKSQLVAMQLAGRFRIRDHELAMLHAAARALEKSFHSVIYEMLVDRVK